MWSTEVGDEQMYANYSLNSHFRLKQFECLLGCHSFWGRIAGDDVVMAERFVLQKKILILIYDVCEVSLLKPVV